MSSQFDIVPSEVTKVYTVKSVNISFYNLILHTSIQARVNMIDENGGLIDSKFLLIEGEEYNNWGNDDDYLRDLILSKLNLSYPVIE